MNDSPAEAALSCVPVVACRELEKTYATDVRAVRGITFEVPGGECFGLLGPNGAGKTTTIEILEGLLPASAGEVRVFGETWGKNDNALRQRIGISLQETRLSEKLTVRETIRLFRSFYRQGHTPDEAIDLVSLGDATHVLVGNLSGGQHQRLALACALVGKPDLIFLDEPTTGLDPGARRQIWNLIRNVRDSGCTVFMTTHYMEEAERLCDRVGIIDHGVFIALDTPANLVSTLHGRHVIEFSVRRTSTNDNYNSSRSDSYSGGGNGCNGDSALTQALVADLDGFQGIGGIRTEGSSLALTVREPQPALSNVLEFLGERNLEITSLTTRNACLEDVFVSLTGRHSQNSGMDGGGQDSDTNENGEQGKRRS